MLWEGDEGEWEGKGMGVGRGGENTSHNILPKNAFESSFLGYLIGCGFQLGSTLTDKSRKTSYSENPKSGSIEFLRNSNKLWH